MTSAVALLSAAAFTRATAACPNRIPAGAKRLAFVIDAVDGFEF
ncbi:hypothetical protein [Actinokineospora globicatena]|nr:hypothetical protein [Actinokineospora globicatena]MCP2303428.1 hypothetical protein [Actinokineospora globicatena]